MHRDIQATPRIADFGCTPSHRTQTSPNISRVFAGHNSLLAGMGCTPVVRHEKWEQLGRQVDLPGVKGGCRVAWPAKRKRALLGATRRGIAGRKLTVMQPALANMRVGAG